MVTESSSFPFEGQGQSSISIFNIWLCEFGK